MRLYLSLLLLINLSIFSPAAKAQDWVQVSSLPSSFNQTHHSFAFSFDNMGYIVTGNSDSGERDDFYQYNPITDSWSELAPFPGVARGFAIGDTWDGKAYFGFGNDIQILDSLNFNESQTDLSLPFLEFSKMRFCKKVFAIIQSLAFQSAATGIKNLVNFGAKAAISHAIPPPIEPPIKANKLVMPKTFSPTKKRAATSPA